MSEPSFLRFGPELFCAQEAAHDVPERQRPRHQVLLAQIATLLSQPLELPCSFDAFGESHGSKRAAICATSQIDALKTISNYTDHLSPVEIDDAFKAEA